MLKIEPAIAAAILPAGRAARPAIFDEKIARVGVHVRDAPRQAVRAADGHDRAAGQRGAHRVFAVAPAERDLVPDRRQAIDFQMRIGRQHRVAGRAPRRAHGPGVAAGQPRQVGQQLQRFVRQPLGDANFAERLEIDAVQIRIEQLAQPLVVDAQLNQFQQQPFVFLLADREAGEAEQLADEQHRRRLPRPRAKTGDPHRQRAAGIDQAVVHALAVPIELLARVFRQAAELAIQIAIQAGPPQKDIHLQQLGLIGDPLGRLAAGDGAGEVDLRRPIDRVHVAPGVERLAPGSALRRAARRFHRAPP